MDVRPLRAQDAFQNHMCRYIISNGSKSIQLTERELLELHVKLDAMIAGRNRPSGCLCTKYHYGESNDDGTYTCLSCGGIINEK